MTISGARIYGRQSKSKLLMLQVGPFLVINGKQLEWSLMMVPMTFTEIGNMQALNPQSKAKNSSVIVAEYPTCYQK